jgi:hypothetical protein
LQYHSHNNKFKLTIKVQKKTWLNVRF